MENALVNQIVDGNSSMHAEVGNRHRTVILPTVLRVLTTETGDTEIARQPSTNNPLPKSNGDYFCI